MELYSSIYAFLCVWLLLCYIMFLRLICVYWYFFVKRFCQRERRQGEGQREKERDKQTQLRAWQGVQGLVGGGGAP